MAGLGFWLPVRTDQPDKVTISSGRWQVGLDNRFLKLGSELSDQLSKQLPVRKTWQGKVWTVERVWVTGDKSMLWFELCVVQNPIPLAAIVAGLGIVGGIVAAVFLVKELRRFLDVNEVVKTPTALIVAIAVVLFVVVLGIRALRGRA